MMNRKFAASMLAFCLLLSASVGSAAAAPLTKTPDNVKDISRQNTYPNPDMDPEFVQPSAGTKELLGTSGYRIENPGLIRLLNETSISNTKLALGFRANIFLGNWALNYRSKETTVNWEYKEANVNKLDNRGGTIQAELDYRQNEDFRAVGGLTTEVHAEEDVKHLMIIKAKEKSHLNLSFRSTVGKGTSQPRMMYVPIRKIGQLQAFVPAVNERGAITYGEVYLSIRGTEKSLVIRNVTKKGVGAWIPIQDKLVFRYMLSN